MKYTYLGSNDDVLQNLINKQRLLVEWRKLDHSIVVAAISQWRRRLWLVSGLMMDTLSTFYDGFMVQCVKTGPMRNPREETSVVLRDHQANLMVCGECSCCATSPYREMCRAKGGIGSGKTLCHDILPCSAYNHCFSGD